MFSLLRSIPASAVLSVALLGASFLLWPNSSHAAPFPEKLSLVAGDTVRIVEPSQFSLWFTVGQQSVFLPDQQPEIEAEETACARIPYLCIAYVPRSHLRHIVSQPTEVLNKTQASEALLAIMDELERDPVNAKLSMDNDGRLTVTAEAVPGLSLNRESSLTRVLDQLERDPSPSVSVMLDATLAPARVSSRTIHDLGLHTKIAEGKTNFRGSPKNRIFNIHRAIEQYDGLVIAPGEEFSFVDYLGEVDGEHGYLPELVIKNNRTEPEFGGGICQVSTTVFRTALNAGLEITERKNHAYPVQYYRPYGLDATIYIPRPDLKFKNNTPGSILMLPKIVGTELTVTFYGTNDGRSVSIDGPHILESNPDGSMRTIFTHTVKSASGETLINATFPSNYKSPHLFPHPGDEVLTEKPKNWSNRQWKEYKALRS